MSLIFPQESGSYSSVGASSTKNDLYNALEGTKKSRTSLRPGTFCDVFADPFGKKGEYASVLHADGVGTKAALAYIYWKETGDLSVWGDIAQDALVMNTDDVLCVGAVEGPYLFSNSIARNARHIPAEVLKALLEGMEAFIEKLNKWGIKAQLCGGETADMGDIARTIVVDATLMTRLRTKDIINNASIKAGDIIVGLGSEGITNYDKIHNSGIGCNGLTLARHVLLDQIYGARYPESFDDGLGEVAYRGKYKLSDQLPNMPMDLGKTLLSPTRSHLPFVKKVCKNHRKKIHGMVHCTGSGQTKSLRGLAREEGTLELLKDNMFPVPPVFKAIQKTGNIPWREMYQIFNMGHRLEIYTDENTADELIKEAKDFGIAAKKIGSVRKAPKDAPNGRISLKMPEPPKKLETYDA